MFFWYGDFEFEKTEGVLCLCSYRGESKHIEIPIHIDNNPVCVVDWGVFRSKNIESVIIPVGMKEIGAGAFADNNLTKVTIPDSVIEIGVNAFVENDLSEIILPIGIEQIHDNAFGYYTDQIVQDYNRNNRQSAIYVWDKEKQEWQSLLKRMLVEHNEGNLNRLLNKNKEDFKMTL